MLGAEHAPDTTPASWSLFTNSGGQSANLKFPQYYDMAVRNGDVGAVVASVPEPETYAMLLAGLGLIGVVGRKRLAQPKSRLDSQ